MRADAGLQNHCRHCWPQPNYRQKPAWYFREIGHHILSAPILKQYAQAHGNQAKTLFLRLRMSDIPRQIERQQYADERRDS